MRRRTDVSPEAIAVATPAMLPTPTVDASAVMSSPPAVAGTVRTATSGCALVNRSARCCSRPASVLLSAIGRSGWNDLSFGGAIPDDELLEAVEESYRLVVARLPRKHRPEGWDA